MIREEFIWTERYRPRTVAETILPVELKKPFQQFVDEKNIPPLLLTGRAGIGKTTIARAMCEEIGCDYIIVNASLERGLDMIRNEIAQFASGVSLTGGRKYVILDEADNLPEATQKALRAFMEQFSANCGFILTANYPAKIIEAIHSRCAIIEFKITKEDKPKMAFAFFKRLCKILDTEGVEYDQKAVAALIDKHYPDWRRTLNETQAYSAHGKIDTGILSNMSETSFKGLMGSLKEKNFPAVRRWVGENADIDTATLYRKLYDTASEYLQANSVPQMILHLGEYSHRAAFVADREINTVALMIEIMADCHFI
jgi:DNA polymerase III delta prime subunit